MIQTAAERGAAEAAQERRFREAMALFPTGLVVAAADDGEQARGLTVASFTSVSLDPPLALVCVRAESRFLPTLRRAGLFAAHVLTAEQRAAAELFAAGSLEDRAAALTRRAGDAGPRLEGALARFELALEAEHPAGDHVLVLGRALRVEIAEGASEPLTWWRSTMDALAPR